MAIQEVELSFKQGLNGYSGTVDTFLLQNSPNTRSANATTIRIDQSMDIQGLLRFDNLFGDLAGQIPAGAQIVSATLNLQTTNAGNGAFIHRMLASWQDTSTWNNLGNGVQADGIEAVATPDLVTGSTSVGLSSFDVTSSVQAWLDGAANNGWVFISQGTNGWDFSSAQGSNPPELTIVYQIDDGTSNAAPIAVDDTIIVDEDASVAFSALVNDSDPDGDPIAVSNVGTPAHGTAVINPNGSISYTPVANFNGSDSFTYSIGDGKGGVATATVNVTVNSINDAPTANNDSANVVANGSVTINVLANDSDVDGDTVSVSGIVSAPTHGSAALNPDGTITFTPVTGYVGADVFEYAVSDGKGGTSTATVGISVLAPDSTPTLQQAVFKQGLNGYGGTVDTFLLQNSPNTPSANSTTIRIDKSMDIQGLLRFDNLFGDLAGQIPANAQIVSATLKLQTTNAGNGAFVHRMLASWQDSNTWNNLGNGVQTDGIEAVATPDLVTGETSRGQSSFDVTSSVQAWLDGAANNGWVFISQGTNGWDFYSAQGSVPPELDIVYTVGGGSANIPPVANDDSATLDQGTSVVISVLANDADGDGDVLTVTGIPTGPSFGSALINANGTITYTPTPGYIGGDSFVYAISDGQGGVATATVQLTVNSTGPANDAPVAVNDTAVVNEDNTVLIAVLGNDFDVNGDPLSVSGLKSGPTHGFAVLNDDGTIFYAPVADYFGADSFTYTLSDGHGGSAVGTVDVTVNPIQDSPTANNDSAITQAGTSVTVGVLLNDTDPDGDTLSVTGITAGPTHGVTVLNLNNTVTYTPTAGYIGQDSFAYAISDGQGGVSVAAVTLTVTDISISASYIATALTSGSDHNLEHGNNSKAFYFNNTWWAVLPDGGSWSIHRFDGAVPQEGQMGGWTVNSGSLFGNNSRADIAWNELSSELYVLQFGKSATNPHVFKLGFDQGSQDWVVETNVTLSGSGGVLPMNVWQKNPEMSIALDQSGNVMVSAISSSTSDRAGLHLAYSTAADLSAWSYTTIDTTTKSDGGSNGNSKADIVAFSQGGVDQIGVFYSRDGSGSDNDWTFAWHEASADASLYGTGWQKEYVANVAIDNHMSAVSDGEFIYAAIKDDNDAIWLFKGNPGAWDAPYLVVDGIGHNPSRPTLVLDDTHDQLYFFYQEQTSSPNGQIYMKQVYTSNLVFDATDLGIKILEGSSNSQNFLDPQSVAHNVGDDTGGDLMLFAKNMTTDEVWYNDIQLGTDYFVA